MSFVCLCKLQSRFNLFDEYFQMYLECLNYQQPVFPILSVCVCVNVLFCELYCADSSFGIIHGCRDSFWSSVSNGKSFCVLIFESCLDLCWLLGTGQRYWTGIPGKRNCLLTFVWHFVVCVHMKDLESVIDFSSSMRLAKLQLAAWQNADHDVRAHTHPISVCIEKWKW